MIKVIQALKEITSGYEFVFIEGFHRLLSDREGVYKVILASNKKDLMELLNQVKNNISDLIGVFLNGLPKYEIFNDNSFKKIRELIYELNDEEITRFKDFLINQLPDNFT